MAKRKKKYYNTDPHAQREAQNYEKPIPSREYILQYLEELGYPANIKHLYVAFEMDEEEDQNALLYRLKAMVRDGQLMWDRRGRFCLLNKLTLIPGRVFANPDGYGFVEPDDNSQSLYLSPKQMRKVLHGDRVLARPMQRGRRGRLEGDIHEVTEHCTQQLVGRYIVEKGHAFVVPDNKRLTHDIHIPHDQCADAKQGDIVMVDITSQPTAKTPPIGKILEVLGEHMAPGMEIDIAIRSHGLPYTWPKAVDDQMADIPEDISEQDLAGRADLRAHAFVTIDGEDARDFDDAVFCQPRQKGGFRLFVAIADVSHYVQPFSALDNEAQLRGNSVYFPERVIPMLPHQLSDNLCSLLPNVDRLVMVCEMTISPQAKLTRSRFYPAVIHSKARLTYTEVAAMLVDKDTEQLAKYHTVADDLQNLYQLYQHLVRARKKRGALEFETIETRIIFNEQKKIEKITPIKRNDAHKLIEECMLMANVATAKFLLKSEVPSLYRVHERPNDERIEDLRTFLAELGLRLEGGKKPNTADYTKVIHQIQNRPDFHIIQMVMLRSLSQAVYSEKNVGHFGLAYDAYTHFTSPIRRYPDLMIHRAIKHIINHQETSYPYHQKECHRLAKHCSETERRADEATRDVVSWLKCEYMRDNLGKAFPGVVSSVTSFGIFVELKDIYVEGLVHVTGLKDDYYQYDPIKHQLIGDATRTTYRLGDEVNVLVTRVDLDERKIDFDLL